MEKPYKFSILCNKTKEFVLFTNIEPRLSDLETWENTNELGVKEKQITKTVYIDTKYKAKLRLYNYIN